MAPVGITTSRQDPLEDVPEFEPVNDGDGLRDDDRGYEGDETPRRSANRTPTFRGGGRRRGARSRASTGMAAAASGGSVAHPAYDDPWDSPSADPPRTSYDSYGNDGGDYGDYGSGREPDTATRDDISRGYGSRGQTTPPSWTDEAMSFSGGGDTMVPLEGTMEPYDDSVAEHDRRYEKRRRRRKRVLFAGLGIFAVLAILILASVLLPRGALPGVDTTPVWLGYPEASFTVTDGPLYTQDQITLDASGSSAPAGLDEYRWDLDGDGEYEKRGSDAEITLSYDDDGPRNVRLKVVDSNGNSDTANRTINIRNQLPLATLETASRTFPTATPTVFTVDASDRDGKVRSVEWDLDGDGRFTGNGPSRTFSATYDDDGSYLAAARVYDDDGDYTETTLDVTVLNQAPAVELVTDVVDARTGEEVDFSLEGGDVDGEITGVRWDFDGDGDVDEEGGSLEELHSFEDDGEYTVTAWVEDDDGEEAEVKLKFTVLNRPPEVTLEADRTAVKTGEDVELTPEGSDPDGEIFSVEWDLDGDGAFEVETPYMEPVTASFPDDGTYLVKVRLLDDDGDGGEASVNITVANRPPMVSPAVDHLEVETGVRVTFDGVCSDPDGSINSYHWDFDGDGIFEYSSSLSPMTAHTYADDGVFAAVLKVVDNDGGITAATLNVTVLNRLPEVDGEVDDNNPTTIDPVTFNGWAEDEDGFVDEFMWDFDGDGEVDWSTRGAPRVQHTYPVPGEYHAVLIAVDDDGGEGRGEVTVNVMANHAPVAVAGLDLEGQTDEPVSFDASGSYDPDGHKLSYFWDFDDDGTWDKTSDSTATATHTYIAAGDYTVRLMVTDGELEGEDTLSAAITDMRLWAVCVGISDYPGSGGDLRYADDDGTDWTNYLVSKGYTVHTLLNSQATESNIASEVAWLVANAGPHDKVVFTYSGHGSNYNDLGWGGTGSVMSTYDGPMSDAELANAFAGLQTSDVCFVFDCCRSGDYNELGTYGGVVLEGCRVYEYTYDGDSSMQNGVFTYYLMQALYGASGADANADGMVSAEEALNYAYAPCSSGWNFHPETYDTNGGEFEFY